MVKGKNFYDISKLNNEKAVDKILEAQVRSGSATDYAKKKFPIKTVYDHTKKRYVAEKEAGGVKDSGWAGKKGSGVQLGHADDFWMGRRITPQNLLYTPTEINKLLGDPGMIDDKINAVYEKQEYGKLTKKGDDLKKFLNETDKTLTRLASQTDGFKQVTLSDGGVFGGERLKVDVFDEFKGKSQKETIDFVNKWKDKSIITEEMVKNNPDLKVTPLDEIENIKKANFFEINRKAAYDAALKMSQKDKTKIMEKIKGGDFNKQVEAYITDTTGKVKQPMLPSGLAGAYEMMSDDLKAIVNSPKFKKFYASKTGKVLSMAARTPTKLFGLADVLFGYLDLTNNKPMMSEAKAWQNMWQAMSFGIYRGGDKQHLAEIKQKFIANGGDGDIFDQVIDLNKSNFKMKNYMENMKKEYQDLTAAGYTNLAKDKMNSAMKNVAKMGNENLDKFEQYKTDLAVSEAGSPIQMLDVMQPAKDAQKAGIELLEEEQIKNFPTTSSQVHTEKGPVANELFNAYWTKDFWKKFLPQNIFLGNFAGPVTDNEKLDAWLKDFQKRDPEGFAEWNLKNRGQDVNNPITLDETAKFMDANKKILGYSVPKAEGGITTLRSKYEYKK